MNIQLAEFTGSFTSVKTCPDDSRAEFAFIGRSNVGKSSLINMLTNKKSLAKVSGTPGKTQMLNYFLIDSQWYLVDLPGYGYARTSKSVKDKFGSMITGYLKNRETLVCTFILIDIRHELQKIDKEFINWCGEYNVPFCLVFTKSDKLGPSQISSNVSAIRKALLKEWESLPPHFVTSAVTRAGRDEITEFINVTLKETKQS